MMDAAEVGPLPWRRERTVEEATGHGRDLSPVALARAYAVLANDGELADGRQLVRVETARSVQGMLEAAVVHPDATGHEARVDGVRVGGKTSCGSVAPMRTIEVDEIPTLRPSSYYCSFVGMLPMDAPRLVVLVGVETLDFPMRQDTDRSAAGPDARLGPNSYRTAAAPDFARLAPRLLELADMR